MIEGNSEKRANIDKAIEVIKILESASKQLKSKTLHQKQTLYSIKIFLKLF